MARFNFSLICQPNFIAKVLRVFPKLALLFLVVHVGLMIYALINSTAPIMKSGKTGEASVDTTKSHITTNSLNNSIVANLKVNNTEHAKNRTLLQGKFVQKLFNRGHHDVR